MLVVVVVIRRQPEENHLETKIAMSDEHWIISTVDQERRRKTLFLRVDSFFFLFFFLSLFVCFNNCCKRISTNGKSEIECPSSLLFPSQTKSNRIFSRINSFLLHSDQSEIFDEAFLKKDLLCFFFSQETRHLSGRWFVCCANGLKVYNFILFN